MSFRERLATIVAGIDTNGIWADRRKVSIGRSLFGLSLQQIREINFTFFVFVDFFVVMWVSCLLFVVVLNILLTSSRRFCKP